MVNKKRTSSWVIYYTPNFKGVHWNEGKPSKLLSILSKECQFITINSIRTNIKQNVCWLLTVLPGFWSDCRLQGLPFTLALSRAGWDLKVVDEGAKAKVAPMNLQLKWPTGESWIVIISSSSTPSTLLQEGGSTPPFYFYSLKSKLKLSNIPNYFSLFVISKCWAQFVVETNIKLLQPSRVLWNI